jgi:penicillin-binding protein 2
VLLVSEQTGDVEATLQALSQIINIGPHERQRILREVRRKRSFVPVTVRDDLEWDDVARIEVNAPDLPGLMIDVGQGRHYPFGREAAHVLGYVAAVSEAEQGSGDPLLQLPGFRVGKSGVEKVYDLALRGRGGTSQVEVNAVGRVIRELEREEGQPGAELFLTIDLELQRMAAARVAGESAAVVVLDVRTGDVLALVSSPSFDPNAFNRGLTGAEWRDLTTDPRGPLINKVIAGQYAPGSTFKIAVTLAALERGTITPATRVFCPGQMELGDAKFHCWKKGGHGSLDLYGALKHSCDVYFYEVARRTGIDRIAAMARRLGLGERMDIDLPGERAGLMPSREWKLATIGQPWQVGETIITGIGQGYILVTPLQLAVMTARVANGGVAVVPRLTRDALAGREGAAQDEPFPSLGLTPAYVQLVRDAMNAVCNEPGGTAFGSRIREAGLEMAGKTGTVQVRRISKAEREQGVKKNEDLPWEERDHALFVGFAPVASPRYAVAVVVEHGGGGSKVAAPIARDVLLECQRRDPARRGAAERVAGRPAAGPTDAGGEG